MWTAAASSQPRPAFHEVEKNARPHLLPRHAHALTHSLSPPTYPPTQSTAAADAAADAAAAAAMESARFDKFEGNDRGAFAVAGAPYEADDAKADVVWAAVDARLDSKSAAARAAEEEAEAKATAAGNISGQVRERNEK